jgi:hypothetical protein
MLITDQVATSPCTARTKCDPTFEAKPTPAGESRISAKAAGFITVL